MSVLIKGMEIPKSCWQCQLLEGHRDDGLCKAANRWLDDDEYFGWYQYPDGDIDINKPLNCPLVEVPTPHGRLIDADALMVNAQYKGKHDIVTAYDIVAAPTIIESEGES